MAMKAMKRLVAVGVLAGLAASAFALLYVKQPRLFERAPAESAAIIKAPSPSTDVGKASVFVNPTANEASRFLTQATFGPRLNEIQALQGSTIDAWLNNQMSDTATPPTYYLQYVLDRDAEVIDTGFDYPHFYFFRERWIKNSLYAPDQLRQRTAFAYSQTFVVSERGAGLEGEGQTLGAYYDILVRNAFGNYRTLLREVTLSPAMGRYLSMYKNRKADPTTGVRPDENYAREVLQLFSVGLVQLNNDGTVKLDAQNKPIPTYNQDTIANFAKVFTGWACSNQTTFTQYEDCDDTNPMKPFDAYHEPGLKNLLVYTGAVNGGVISTAGTTVPAGGTVQDLDAAIDNIFNHPNVGPFISKQLIQRLVTSNPSPAYVGRVASVFNDSNGATAGGVRGDMRAVIRAILIDDEARNGHINSPNTFGKVREPILRFTHLWRVYNANSQSGFIPEWGLEDDIGQFPLRSPSVFNFYFPDYMPPGEMTTANLVSPELQIGNDSLMATTANNLFARVFYAHSANTGVDYDRWPLINIEGDKAAAAAANPDPYIEQLNLIFLSGQMSPELKAKIKTRVTSIGTWTDSDRFKAQNAVFLTMASPEYMVQR